MTELDIEFDTLKRHIRKDIVLDTGGNLLLGIGLYCWVGHPAWVLAWMRSEAFIVLSTGTGIFNLFHLPGRLRRFRRWQELREGGR